jgi:CHAD domain-containing protein
LKATLEDEWRAAREEMLAALDSPRYDRLVAAMAAALRRGPLRTSRASRAPVLATAPDIVLDRYRAVRKAARRIGPSSSPRDYHRLRIRGKRLRYALEFLEEVYPQEIPPVIRRLVELQNLLGAHQDADVAIRRLRSTAAERGSTLPPDTVLAMGIITQRYLDEAAELRSRFRSVNGRLSDRSWRTVKKAMRRRRPEPSTPHRPTTPSLVPSELGA